MSQSPTTTTASSTTHNVACRLDVAASQNPAAAAIIVARAGRKAGQVDYKTYTFSQLQTDTDRIAAGLRETGVTRGTKLALFVRFGYDFVALVFALFKIGAVQILIDPGMGLRQLLACLDDVQADGFVAIPPVHAVRALLSRRFAAAQHNVTVGRRWFWGGTTLDALRRTPIESFAPIDVEEDELAAIIFTSGSTGPAKGVAYRHGIFSAQVDQIRDRFAIQPGEIDMSCFPLFALFNCAMGVTTVIPTINPSRPAAVDPQHLVDVANDCRITQAFASPAVWNRVARHCEATGERMTTLRRVLSAGAPVPGETLARLRKAIAPDGEIHTPYGATEALPVASISASEVLDETQTVTDSGGGVCVGQRFDEIQWKVIRITDEPLATLADADELPAGEIGELIVSGPVVTWAYATRTEANDFAKISDGGTVWHRMGDVGYLDDDDRFWFCGRKSHRVETVDATMFTIPCEAIINQRPAVFRSALVGIGPSGRQRPLLVVEPHDFPASGDERRSLVAEIRVLAQQHPLTSSIDDVLLHRSLPVDVRHNAKIAREKLADWASGRVGAVGQAAP